jgi:hypothetical protein
VTAVNQQADESFGKGKKMGCFIHCSADMCPPEVIHTICETRHHDAILSTDTL